MFYLTFYLIWMLFRSSFKQVSTRRSLTCSRLECSYVRRRSSVDTFTFILSFLGRRLLLVPYLYILVIMSQPLRSTNLYLALPLLQYVSVAMVFRISKTAKEVAEVNRTLQRVKVQPEHWAYTEM